mgnify:CR=1 FL=1
MDYKAMYRKDNWYFFIECEDGKWTVIQCKEMCRDAETYEVTTEVEAYRTLAMLLADEVTTE